MQSLILSIVGLSVLCHLSWARGCCVPKQWTGDMGFMVGTNRNGKGGYQAVSVLIIDPMFTYLHCHFIYFTGT